MTETPETEVLIPTVEQELEKLRPLFDAIFKGLEVTRKGREFEKQSKWPEYERKIRHFKNLKGIILCKTISFPSVWIPVYHYSNQNPYYKRLVLSTLAGTPVEMKYYIKL